MWTLLGDVAYWNLPHSFEVSFTALCTYNFQHANLLRLMTKPRELRTSGRSPLRTKTLLDICMYAELYGRFYQLQHRAVVEKRVYNRINCGG